VFGLNGKIELFTKDLQVGKADVNCWKRGVFELADISQGYDGRRPICNKIIKSIHENIGTIINGKPYVGKTILLKRLIYEMTNDGYSVIFVNDASLDSASLVEFIKRINNWNILQRILIIADDMHQINHYSIFKTFNHIFRLGTSNIRFLLAGDMSKIGKTQALLEHDKNSEIDYAMSMMHEIFIDLKLSEAKIFVRKLKQLGLLPARVNTENIAQDYYALSRGNPFVFIDHLRWLISGRKSDYKHPTLNYDFSMKNHVIEKNKDLMKPAIYSAFLSSFGIHPSVDILKLCGVYMNHLIGLSRENFLARNDHFTLHEAWAIEFLVYLYSNECGSDFDSFDSKYEIKNMILCLLNNLDIKYLIIIIQRCALLLGLEKYTQLINEIMEEFFIREEMQNEEKVELYTFGYAKFYSSRKDYSNAIAYYDKALEINRVYIPALNDKGTILYDLRDYASAIACYDTGLEIEPKNQNLLYNKGMALQGLNQNYEAIECYDQVIVINKYDAFAWLNKGNAFQHLKRYAEAEKCYDRALEVDPANTQAQGYAMNNKGSILYEQKKFDDGLIWINKALRSLRYDPMVLLNKVTVLKEMGKTKDAFRWLDKGLRSNPKNHNMLGEKGLILCERGNYEEGLEYFDRAIQVKKDDMAILNNKATAFLELGNYQAAKKILDEILLINPKYINALINRGSVSVKLNKDHEAVQFYDEGLKVDPSNIQLNILRGESYYRLGDYIEAIKSFEKALEGDRMKASVWASKGLSEYNVGYHFEAIKSFDKALEVDAGNVVALANKGLVLGVLGRYEDAIVFLDKATRVNPHHVFAWLNKGLAFLKLGEHAKALKCYNTAVTLNPNLPKTWNEMGLIYYAVKKYKKAIFCYNKSIKLDPNNAQFWYNKGFVLVKLGKRKKAEECFDKAVKLDKNLT